MNLLLRASGQRFHAVHAAAALHALAAGTLSHPSTLLPWPCSDGASAYVYQTGGAARTSWRMAAGSSNPAELAGVASSLQVRCTGSLPWLLSPDIHHNGFTWP